jgi:hypothetical protein
MKALRGAEERSGKDDNLDLPVWTPRSSEDAIIATA